MKNVVCPGSLTKFLVSARVVRTSVVAVGNAVAIAVAAVAHAVAVVVSTMTVAAHGVNDTAGKTGNGDQHYSKLLHIVSPREMWCID
jgi:hypothetical protein